MDRSADRPPQFSVVIPTCNRPTLLIQCLDQLSPKAQELGGDTLELIVTDDGAKQNSVESLINANYPSVRWIQGPRRGPAANRNNGVRFATGDWILFCDDDCLPDANLLGAYSGAQQSYPGCQVFEGQTMADREKRHPLEESPINEKGGNLWSCNFVIRRTLFEKMGGFDETFPDAVVEDMEFRVRLEKAGVQIVFLNDAVVVHPWRKLTVLDYVRQQARHRRSHVLLMQKHPEFRNVFTTWNVVKDIVRYFVRHCTADLARCGLRTLLYQPLFLWCQLQRIITYRFSLPHADAGPLHLSK